MYAIVEIAGKQYRVEEQATVVTDRLAGEAGQKVELDRVLMLVDGKEVKVGTPTVEGAKIQATITGEVRGPKIIVFKKKRRKGYRRTRGHRQTYTALQIDKIQAA